MASESGCFFVKKDLRLLLPVSKPYRERVDVNTCIKGMGFAFLEGCFSMPKGRFREEFSELFAEEAR